MCQRIDCPQCGKPTFSGCGRHVETVLRDVPLVERCHCSERYRAPAAGAAEKWSWFDALFGRGRKTP